MLRQILCLNQKLIQVFATEVVSAQKNSLDLLCVMDVFQRISPEENHGSCLVLVDTAKTII